MKSSSHTRTSFPRSRHFIRGATLALLLGAAPLLLANHPVLVEGEQDFDGDGRIGLDEDMDVDPVGFPVFGTLTGALAAANAGGNQNARISIVTSGRFREIVVITGVNGNVTIEAAPGVDAVIDAIASGNPGGGNAARAASPGIIVDAPNTRIITLRNLVSRNWTEGIRVQGDSRVHIDRCRVEQNINYGIRVLGNAVVTVDECKVSGSGFRVGAGVNPPPSPGIGIEFEGNSCGMVCRTSIVGSFAGGLVNSTGNKRGVRGQGLCLFDNNPDLVGIKSKEVGE